MLRDPELREAYEAISNLPHVTREPHDLAQRVAQLEEITLLLLRALDHTNQAHARHLSILQDACAQNVNILQEVLYHMPKH